jgi:homoaconitate hydratase family protein
MKKSIVEKILTSHSDGDVKTNDRVWAELDMAVARDFGGPNCVLLYEEKFNDTTPAHPNRIAFTFDYQAPAKDPKVANNQQICRDFANKHGIPHLFDVNTGIGQHILLENGLVRPGDVIIGTDSHMNLLGAVGAFSVGVGTTDIVAGWRMGKLWFRTPETINVKLTGELKYPASAKDFILYFMTVADSDTLNYRSIEFVGEGAEGLNLAERITICSMITEAGGKIGFFVPDKEILTFIGNRCDCEVNKTETDEGYEFFKEYEIDLSKLEPVVACPHTPDNVHPVSEVKGQEIDSVFIGSCTNGRIEDLEVSAEILKKASKIKNGMRLTITPATMEVAREALKRGYFDIFYDAGAMVTNPGCSLCTVGHHGVLYAGERLFSTSNRNFLHKLGRDAEIYLGSPAVATATAITGVITDPEDI